MKKVHYSVFVAVGCFLIMFYGMGMTFNLASLFLSNMVAERGFSQGHISDAMTLQSIVSLLCIFMLGKVYAKYSTRMVVAICSFAGVLAYLCFTCDSLAFCYLGAALVGITHGGAALVPVTILITNWFEKSRGVALSVCMMGSSGANIVCSKIVSVMLEKYGVARASVVHAGIILVLIIIAMLLIRDEPKDKGLKAFGAEETPGGDCEIMDDGVEIPSQNVLGRRAYAFVAVASFMVGFVITPLNAFYPTFLRSVGYDTLFLGTAATIFGVTMSLSKLAAGTIIDFLGLRLASVYLYILPFSAVISALMVTKMPVSAVLFVALWGFGNPIGTVPLPLWVQNIFGVEGYRLIYSRMLTVFTLGSTVGMWLIGNMADYFGSYRYYFLIDLVMLGSSFFILMKYLKPRVSSPNDRRKQKNG